jgi:hypothetical protein
MREKNGLELYCLETSGTNVELKSQYIDVQRTTFSCPHGGEYRLQSLGRCIVTPNHSNELKGCWRLGRK